LLIDIVKELAEVGFSSGELLVADLGEGSGSLGTSFGNEEAATSSVAVVFSTGPFAEPGFKALEPR